jgi:hypothetical protein
MEKAWKYSGLRANGGVCRVHPAGDGRKWRTKLKDQLQQEFISSISINLVLLLLPLSYYWDLGVS